MRDLHKVIINDVGEVVSRQIVCGLIQHFIIEDIAIDDHFATNEVVNMYILVRLYFETNHVFLAFVNKRFYFLCRHGEGVTHLHTRTCVILKIRYLCTLGFEFFGRVKRYIRMTGIEQLLYVLMIDLATLTLSIRTVLADSLDLAVMHAKTLVDADTEPVEGFEDIFFCAWHEAGGVCIFDTKEHITPVLAGKKIVIQRGTNTANVQRARRRWRETNSYSSFHIHFSIAAAKVVKKLHICK